MSCEDIPSLLDLQKVKKHADDFGRLMGTGTGTSTNEVTGQVRPTYNAVMANLGYTRVGTFATGGTLTTGRQTLLWDVADGGDGQEYGWSGSFLPSGKTVPPGSTPLTTGGIAVGAWMSRFDPEMRGQVREALRRSYAEAGYNLVDGSFEAGGTLVNANDVMLYEATSVAYSWLGALRKVVHAGSSPSSTGGISPSGDWVDVGDASLRNELSSDTGSEIVGYRLTTSTQKRNVDMKLRERVTINDFGGNGNDSSDNTAAFADAVAWMIDNGRRVVIPEGVYVTDPFSVYALAYSKQIGFVGEDKVRSVIKRLSNGVGAFVTFGNSAQTLFCVTNPLTNLTVNGGADTNGDAVVIYDWVRGVMDNIKFSGGTTALRLYGGISCRLTNYTLEMAKVGFKATKYASAVGGAGGGWPNLITLSGGEIVDNKQWGAYFDDGRMLRIRDTDIEGNGSVGFSGGGLYVGAGVGGEVAPGNALSLGVLADNVWFESNVGVYDFGQDGGFNRINGCTFHSIGTTNDFAATAGRYRVTDCDSTFTKAVNFNEGAGVLSGNVIDGSEFPNLNYDANKTEIKAATITNLRNGGKMSVNGYGAPRELVGQDSTAAVATITFNPPFKTGTTPRICTQVLADDSTASHYSVEVYWTSNTGFTMRKKRITTGTATATNFNVVWRAVGEAN